jgi:glycosyltransferase involved in cell wall biosynthesis
MRSMVKKRVALVIPAYNEGKVIKGVIVELKKVFKKSNYNFQIIVVDDGSKDNTAEKAQSAGAIVIKHILNMGSGSATSTGLSYASQKNFDIATTSDADGQHAPQDILRGVDKLVRSKTDLLIGSRFINHQSMSQAKVLGNKGLSFITYLLFGINVTDSQSGLRIFSKRALESLKWKTSGYEFCSEMIWRAKQLKLKIGEYPIKAIYTDYSTSRGRIIGTPIILSSHSCASDFWNFSMSRYLILVILNTPLVIAALLSAFIDFKMGRTSIKVFFRHVILWLFIFAGLACTKFIYESLFSHGLTQTEPLSLFDVIEITGIIFVLFMESRSRIKIGTLERRVQDLHQELSIRLSGDTHSKPKKR